MNMSKEQKVTLIRLAQQEQKNGFVTLQNLYEILSQAMFGKSAFHRVGFKVGKVNHNRIEIALTADEQKIVEDISVELNMLKMIKFSTMGLVKISEKILNFKSKG